MKKLFTLFTFLAAMFGVTQTWAASYNLWVGGVQVTDDNMSNIVPNGLTSGKIYYIKEANCLILNSVVLSADEDKGCILNTMESGLYVRFDGINRLTSNGNANTIYSTTQLNLSGISTDTPPTLYLTCNTDESKGYSAIYQNSSSDLSIKNLYLEAKSTGMHCIIGKNDTPFYTSASQIHAEAGVNAISRFSSWKMSDRGKLTESCYYDTSSKCVRSSEGQVVNQCMLVNGLYIGYCMPNIDLESVTCNPKGLTLGTITWSKSANKLTLDGVTFEASNRFVNNVNVPDLIIETKNENNITCPEAAAFGSYVNTQFIGSGRLQVSGKYGISIIDNAKITININAVVRFDGERYGYYGYHHSTRPNCDLVLVKAGEKSDYYFSGGTSGITLCSHLILDEMDFYYSEELGTACCYFDENSHDVRSIGGNVVSGTDINFYKVTKKYPIYIAGKQLNNCNFVAGPGSPYITTGSINYSPDDNILTLDGVTMDASNDDEIIGIKTTSEAGDLTIDLVGSENQKLTTSSDVIDLSSNTTISGSTRIYLNSTKESGITTRNGCSVTLNTSTFMEIKGAKYGYWGNGASMEKLILKKKLEDNRAYRFVGNEGTIYNVKNLVLDNMDFWDGYSITAHPEDGYLNGCYFEDGAMRVNGGEIAKGRIAFGSIKKRYPVYICGKQLVSTNSAYANSEYDIYIGSPYISSGSTSVVYNPSTQTLTLDNAEVNYNNEEYLNHGIISTDENTTLNVNVKDYNTLTSTNAYSGLWLGENSDVTIDGYRTLILAGSDDDLYTMGATVTIQGDVQLKALQNGIGSNHIAKEIIVGGNAVVMAKHISYVTALTLKDVEFIAQPLGAEFSAADQAIMLNGELAHDVVIKPNKFDLWIAGTQVTSANCYDILGDGVFSYEVDLNQLTVTGDCTYNDYIIESFINNLTIKVASESHLNTTAVGRSIIRLHASTKITGGPLTLENIHQDKEAIGIYIDAGSLTIDEAQLSIIGDGFYYGITGNSFLDLYISYSDISVTAHDYGAISDWGEIILTGCNIIEPNPWQILSSAIADGDGNIVGYGTEGTVVIALDPDGINSVRTAKTVPAEVYDLSGRRLDQVRHGVNIVRDKEGKISKILHQ